MSTAVGIVALSLVSAGTGQAFIAQNQMRVEARGATAFTVPYTTRSSPRAFWCAAGDYAIRALGLPKATRIYRTTPPPRKSGEGMSFSLDPSLAVPPGLLRLSGEVGLTASYARFQCEHPSALE